MGTLYPETAGPVWGFGAEAGLTVEKPEELVPGVLAMAICVAILVAFPQIALFLPNAMK